MEDPKKDKEGFKSPRRRVVLVVSLVAVVILLAMIVPIVVVLTKPDPLAPVCPNMDERERVDCHPGGSATRDRCEARGCCWSPAATRGPPSCFYPTNHGYEVDGEVEQTATGYRARLRRLDTPSMYGGEVETVEVLVEMQEQHRLHMKILDAANVRYEVPDGALRVPRPGQAVQNTMYDVTFTNRPFSIKVTRKSTGAVIFDTSVGKLTFADQFLSVSTRLASSNLYGLGEHVHKRYRHDLNWKTWPIFASGANPFGFYENLYGHHPFYMCMEDDGKANGVMLLNSNAMDVTLQPGAPDSAPIVTYRVVGGVLDFYMFTGPTPENVVQQYTEIIGRPIMPAYWGLGFQLCRWNYTNTAGLREVIERNRATGIPYDVQYGDIDYMEDRKDFTYDDNLYQGLPELVQELHDHGQKYIIILDPAITNSDRRDGSPYEPYRDGLRDGVFVKAADGETNLIGEVWPGTTLFPDYTNPSTNQWWSDHCERFHNDIPYDGLWIDMNEPKSFMNGSNNGCENNRWNYPPYTPAIVGSIMYENTLCMDSQQYWGKHYDVHSMYGHSMAISTREAMSRVFPTKRGVIITRSSFPGTGQYAGHWLGSNTATWEDMQWSVPALFELNMFGIPYIGADICGFLEVPSEQLCQRWMQLGAFYPFSRNHNHRNFQDQDPAVFSQAMIDSTRTAMMTRYTLLPYLYTLFYHAHVTGATVVRPLLNEFPADSNTWDVDMQILWGSGLMITPVLTKDTTIVSAYFPDIPWYDYYTGQEVEGEYRGQAVTLDAPLDKINLHVRGGVILPTQQPANTTVYSRRNPMGLIVAMDDSSAASGTLFWDDGEAVDSIDRKDYLVVNFIASSTELMCDVEALPLGGPTPGHWANLQYDTVLVYGLDLGAGTPVVQAGPPDGSLQTVAASRVQYDSNNKVLRLTDLKAMDFAITDNLKVTWG